MEEKDKRQRSKEEKLIFLKAAEEHGITEACQRFGIPHTTYYYWKKMEEQRLFHLEFGPNKEVIASERALAPPRGYPRVYATNAPQERLSVPEALEIYRDEWTIENNFRRLKGPLLSMVPLYLRDETCVTGLLILMTIALKLLTLMEFVVRRNLEAEAITLEGLYISNPRKKTERPTAERLLELFGEITPVYGFP